MAERYEDVQTRNSRGTAAASPAPREMHPVRDFKGYAQEYARRKPDVAALWCFGLGFVLGWKVKPW